MKILIMGTGGVDGYYGGLLARQGNDVTFMARGLISGIMREVEALARAQGIVLDEDVVAKSLEFIDNSEPHIKPSMQLDVEAGRRTEIESMIGVIGRKGRELGVPTPIADFVYAALLPIEQKARKDPSSAS